ncbi:MAG: DUF1566 domain-containing protein [Desulfocapsa sp.]|nr:DUF1566 domain-containing protein [Desulfocapsa sp.]
MQPPVNKKKYGILHSPPLRGALYSARMGNGTFTKFLKKTNNEISKILKYLSILCLITLCACAQFGGDTDEKRFQLNSDGTVLDTETDLMWAAAATSESMTWAEAEEYCTSFTGAEYQDWRLPKKDELAALFKAGIGKDNEMIRINGDRVWASETDDNRGAYCNFFRGNCGWLEKVVSISLHGLPVRNTETTAPSVPPAAPIANPQTVEQRLQVLELLYKQKLITKDEYESKKAAILKEL